jgi:hypothetical protein
MTYTNLNDLPGRPVGRPQTVDQDLARQLAALGCRIQDIANHFGVTQGRISQIIGVRPAPTVAEALAVIEAGERKCEGCAALRLGALTKRIGEA